MATEPQEDFPSLLPASEGRHHLVWIERFQFLLLGVGSLAWLFKGLRASLVFLAGGALSLAFWYLHRLAVGRMLQPAAPRRWFYALLFTAKLALIALGLRAMMASFPTEAVPLTTGILLFVGGILLEAARLGFGAKAEDGE